MCWIVLGHVNATTGLLSPIYGTLNGAMVRSRVFVGDRAAYAADLRIPIYVYQAGLLDAQMIREPTKSCTPRPARIGPLLLDDPR